MTAKRKPAPSAGGSKSSGKPPSRPAPSDRILSSKISSSSPTPRPKPSSSSPKPAFTPQRPQAPVAPSLVSASSEMATRLAIVRSNWESIAGGVALASLFDALEQVTGQIDGVSQALSSVRARGYRFGREWETQLEAISGRWPQQHTQAIRLLEGERRVLQSAAQDVDNLLQRANRDAGLVSTAESRIAVLQSNINAAERRVRDTFDQTQQQAYSLQREIDKVQFLLDALDEASFDLLPDEHAIAACEAVWASDQEEPEGRLFLTDARLIFEQWQEVAKKKVLFITTEKELIQKKLWESPIGAVEELEAEDKKSFLRRQELLTLRFSERTRETPGDVTLQLKDTDNESWRALIRKAKTGQIDNERYGAPAPEQQLAATIEQEATTPPKELPTVCPNCSAPLPPIFKGMKQVACDYCGTIINI